MRGQLRLQESGVLLNHDLPMRSLVLLEKRHRPLQPPL
jgi:hypothetical protein